MLFLMETLPNSLAHTSRGGEGDPGRNNDRLLSTYCISQCGIVVKTASSQSVWV